MMTWFNNYFNILKTVSFILLALLLVSCQGAPDIDEVDFSENLPDEQADSIMIYAYTDSVLDYKLNAFHIDKFYDLQLTIADTVYIETFNPDSSVRSTLYCDKAELDESRNILTGLGNVMIKSENGILKTSYIIWDRNSDSVLAKNGVTVIRDDNILRGEELKTDINLDEIEMVKVSAEGKLDEVDIDW
jgi:LPS export ABC transporter protein LptC